MAEGTARSALCIVRVHFRREAGARTAVVTVAAGGEPKMGLPQCFCAVLQFFRDRFCPKLSIYLKVGLKRLFSTLFALCGHGVYVSRR